MRHQIPRGIFFVTILCVLLNAPAQSSVEPMVEARIKKAGVAYAAAAWQLDAAKQRLEQLRSAIAPQFKIRPEWKEARQRMDEARRELEQTRLAAMRKDPHYATLVLQRDNARAFLESITKASSDKRIYEAVKNKNDAELALLMLEKEAEAKDPPTIDAKKEFSEARRAWDGLQSQLDEAVKEKPEYETCCKEVELSPS